MVNFNIKDHLLPEEIIEKDPHRFDDFYGEMDDKPETEQQLFKYQMEYLKTRDMKVWSEMFDLCYSYMRSLILKRITGKNFVPPDEINDRTTSATLAFMSQYLTKSDFEVGASFAGMMKWKIIEFLYKPSTDDKAISLSMEIDKEGSSTLEDLIDAGKVYDREINPEDIATKVSSEEIIDEIFAELDEIVDDAKALLLIRLYILLCVHKPKNRHAKRLFLDTWAKDYKIEKLINYVTMELYNRLRAHA